MGERVAETTTRPSPRAVTGVPEGPVFLEAHLAARLSPEPLVSPTPCSLGTPTPPPQPSV